MCLLVNKHCTAPLESFWKLRTLWTILCTELLVQSVACKRKHNSKIIIRQSSSNKLWSCYTLSNDMLSDGHLLCWLNLSHNPIQILPRLLIPSLITRRHLNLWKWNKVAFQYVPLIPPSRHYCNCLLLRSTSIYSSFSALFYALPHITSGMHISVYTWVITKVRFPIL